MAAQIQTALSILRRKQLESKVGLRRSTIYARLDPKSKSYDPSFPRPVSLGGGNSSSVGWVEAEVEAWIESKIKNSRAAG